MITTIILAGGSGTRVGAGCPKQFIEVLGKPILSYTIDIFESNSKVDNIIIVCHKDWIDYCNSMIKKYDTKKVSAIIQGGNSFQDSVICGIRYLQNLKNKNLFHDSDYVLIHYAASPFTSQDILNDVIRVTLEKGSAVTGTPCYQLMGSIDDNNTSKTWINRDKCIQIASPYGFEFSYLQSIYTRAIRQNLLSSIEPHTTSLMYALGDTINLAYGNQTNIKITTKEDIELFQGYVILHNLQSSNIRTESDLS